MFHNMFFWIKIYIYISIFAFIIHMIFTNHRKTAIPNQQTIVQTAKNSTLTSRFVNSLTNTNSPQRMPKVIIPPEPVAPAQKQMKWGEPTWYLFHTMAEKVKPEYFEEFKSELFDIIKTICNTLPCPNCAKHATDYMNKIYIHSVRTKEDLQLMLWRFHNEVNTRKGFSIFPFEELSSKYSTAMTRKIIQHFMHFHEDKHASFRMISDDYHRSRVSRNLRTWFISNIHIFEE